MTTEDCCAPVAALPSGRCPRCHRGGRPVPLLTVKSLLTGPALERLEPIPHRFCATADCDVVYYSGGPVFRREDVRVPVFHKEPDGGRTICYCFELNEDEADASAESLIRAHVRAGRCACEVRNPEGKCCLGNLRSRTRRPTAEVSVDG